MHPSTSPPRAPLATARLRRAIAAGAALAGAAALSALLSCADFGSPSVPEVPGGAGSVTIVTPGNPMTLGVGQSAQFAAEVRNHDGSILADPPLAWLSSDPGVLSIDAAGLAHALAPGTATIQARSIDMLSAGVAVTVHNPAPSYATVIQPIWNANCTRCHGSDGGLSLSGDAYERIVNVTSAQNRAFKRIVPGNPNASYMLRKLEGCSTAGCVGGSMPPGAPLPAAQLQLIRDWVLGGCPR